MRSASCGRTARQGRTRRSKSRPGSSARTTAAVPSATACWARRSVSCSAADFRREFLAQPRDLGVAPLACGLLQAGTEVALALPRVRDEAKRRALEDVERLVAREPGDERTSTSRRSSSPCSPRPAAREKWRAPEPRSRVARRSNPAGSARSQLTGIASTVSGVTSESWRVSSIFAFVSVNRTSAVPRIIGT